MEEGREKGGEMMIVDVVRVARQLDDEVVKEETN